jgi:hypothetical protein
MKGLGNVNILAAPGENVLENIRLATSGLRRIKVHEPARRGLTGGVPEGEQRCYVMQ